MNLEKFFRFLTPAGGNIVLFALAIAMGIALRVIAVFVLNRWLRHVGATDRKNGIGDRLKSSLSALLPALLLTLTLPLFNLSPGVESFFSHMIQLVLIASLTWFVQRLVTIGLDLLTEKLDVKRPDNIRQRRLLTQLKFTSRLTTTAILIIGFGAMLLSFDGARKFGASLLASAGIVSVIAGFAAQRSLANLMAGLQIAFTQPLRLDDVVVIENQWGRIEEINLTYVVVKIWDLRRLILPITYLIEKPFENWTRVSADILSSVFLYVDYAIPVERVRAELARVLSSDKRWDGKVCALHVIDFTEQCMKLRCLMSASDASLAFELSCEVRERMITFIQREFPDALPRTRAAVSGMPTVELTQA